MFVCLMDSNLSIFLTNDEFVFETLQDLPLLFVYFLCFNSECHQQNDPEVTSCQDAREDAKHLETATDEPTQEQSKAQLSCTE